MTLSANSADNMSVAPNPVIQGAISLTPSPPQTAGHGRPQGRDHRHRSFGTSYVSASGTGWTCANVSGVVTCSRSGSTAVGFAARATVLVTLPPPRYLRDVHLGYNFESIPEYGANFLASPIHLGVYYNLTGKFSRFIDLFGTPNLAAAAVNGQVAGPAQRRYNGCGWNRLQH